MGSYAVPLILFFMVNVLNAQFFTTMQLTQSFPFGQYYATIYMGNPPQPQSVIIDNYQKMLVLNCKGCLSCHTSPRHQSYSFSGSLSSKEVQCKDQIFPCRGYCNKKASTQICKIDNSDYFGTYSVKMVSDEVRMVQIFEGQAAKPYFGCIVSQDLDKNYDENGVLGLALTQSNIFNSLFHLESNEYIKQIGLCLANQTGYLQIGKIPNYKKQEYVSLRMASDNIYGLTGVQDILFGDTSIKQDYSLRQSGVMIMTRLAYTLLPGKAFTQVKDMIKQTCSVDKLCEIQATWQEAHRKIMNCISFNKKIDLDAVFPPLKFKFQDYEVSWNASEYLVPGQPSNTSDISSQYQEYYCLTFMNQTKIEKYALGINFLQKKHVIFDVQSSSIMIKDNYDCSQRRILVIQRGMNYIAFIIVTIALFGRSSIVKIIKLCQRKMRKVDETLNEQSTYKDKDECIEPK